MASRKLSDLSDSMQALTLRFLEECKARRLDVLIYCTLRPNAEQDELYARHDGSTNARGGQSAHNPDAQGKAHAFDGCPQRGGKPVWGYRAKDDAELWRQYGAAAEAAGLLWSGRWTGKMKEMAHCQDPDWRKSE